MMLNDITSLVGAHRRRKRVGRGESSGLGKTCGRGNKGCLSRAGGGPRPLHEGGQMPIFRRLPKRGFSNFQFRRAYEIVNLAVLEKSFGDGQTVDPDGMRAAGLIDGERSLIKVLGQGPLTKRLTVVAHAFSASAKAAIESAGGVARVIERPAPAVLAKAKRGTKQSTRATTKTGGPASPSEQAQEKSEQ